MILVYAPELNIKVEILMASYGGLGGERAWNDGSPL